MKKPSENIAERTIELINSKKEWKELIEKGSDEESTIVSCAIAIQAIIDYLDSVHG